MDMIPTENNKIRNYGLYVYAFYASRKVAGEGPLFFFFESAADARGVSMYISLMSSHPTDIFEGMVAKRVSDVVKTATKISYLSRS